MDPTFMSSFDAHPLDGGGSRYTTRVPYRGVFNITIESVADGHAVTISDPTTAWEYSDELAGSLEDAAWRAQAVADERSLVERNAATLPEASHPLRSDPAGPVA